ncbi:RHS domain-containing protein [Variovorax sp. ZS18.2.2]|uniref:RHS repeat-associated core domain-containing protein n=1 Tax=Variovorax sp. ZS18.2.2 TaxID=2971255 RepID=UPI002150CBE7|nr:RHS repeat-associated core domain-containing protein [Variovorax sp. ZS18.2.2]MCR6477814.1 RHS domain-containing protein [Variovorax sp. ZS18.2.2]
MAVDQSAQDEREPQVAVAPLNTIDQADIGAGAAKLDEWLRYISGGWITLGTLATVAGSIPVVGNIMALADAIMDVVRMIQKKSWDQFLEWVSLAINVIGIIPIPPSMAAARMSLRPMLALTKQGAARAVKEGIPNLGEALISAAVYHLNDTIAGEIDKFVDGATNLLDGMMKDCADMVDAVVNMMIDVMQRGIGEKPLLEIAAAQADKTYDPQAQGPMGALLNTWNWWGQAVSDTTKSGVNFVASKASGLIPQEAVAMIKETIGSLVNIKQVARNKLLDMADAGARNSIKWLLVLLKTALVKRRNRKNGVVPPPAGTRVDSDKGGGELVLSSGERPAGANPNCCKLGATPDGTNNSISFALGNERFTHTDFVLPATLPIEWSRTYSSNLAAYDHGSLGARWLTPYTTRVDVVESKGQQALAYRAADGRSHALPWLAVGQSHRNAIEEFSATRLSETLLVLDFGKPLPAGEQAEWRETYELVDTAAGKAAAQGKQHFRLVAQHARDGAAIGLRYDHIIAAGPNAGEQVLSDILSKQGDVTLAHVGIRPNAITGRIESLWELKDGQVVRQLAGYTHDDAGDLIAAQDENGAAWTYQYSHHLVTRYADRTGRGMNLAYDGTGADAKAIREWADDGSFDTKLEWDKNIRLTYVTDALGQETWIYYDILGYTYRVIYPDQNEEWFFRDDAKNITRHIHPDGGADEYIYDAAGNLLTHTQADGSQVHFEYDKLGRLTGVRDPEGGAWLRDYNPQGHLTEETDPLGHKTQYAYDKAGRPVQITDAKGGVKKLAYTPTGELASYTDCSGKTTTWSYDSRGRLAQSADAAGQTTKYRYTPLSEQTLVAAQTGGNHPGQLEEIVHPDQTKEQLAHDAEGRLLTHTDALARSTHYRYADAGLIAGRTDAAGHTLSYQWDPLGRLVQLQNENNSRYQFKYDPVGRLLEETGFDGKLTKYRYEETSGVLAEVAEAGQVTRLAFDPLGRLVEREAAAQTETFAYDGNGRLIEARNQDAKLQWFYDPAGNLTREHHADLARGHTAIWQHRYNELNQRVGSTRPDGHTQEWLTYGSGHVHGLLLDGQDILGLERDDLHREVGRQQHNGVVQTQTYDPAGRLLEQQIARTTKPAGAPSATGTAAVSIRRSYHYDKAGQLTGIGDSRRGRLDYRYDPVGRLLEAQSQMGKEVFAFDPAGNIGNPVPDNRSGAEAFQPMTLAREQRVGHATVGKLLDNLLKDYAGTTYKYDERGNLVERIKNGRKTAFSWDGFNRMISAKSEEGTTSFRYDPMGRRIAKASGARETVFGWDGDTIAYESAMPSNSNAQEQAHTVHYVHEKDSFVPLVQVRRPGPLQLSPTTDVKALMQANGGAYDIEQDPLWNGQGLQQASAEPFTPEEIAFYQCDHLGTPQELTDSGGNVCWSASYKAWGEAKQTISEAAKRAGIANPIRFQGQYLDEETGLHYNRYRYYDPHSGRFVSGDLIKLAGGANLYRFAPNPITWVDPSGLCSTALDRNLGGVSGDGMQAHHVIPEEVWANNGAFLNTIGLSGQRDVKENGMLLPGSQGKAKAMGKKVYHCGSHALYSAMVDARVKSIRTAYDSKAITAGEAKQEIGDLQGQLKLAINAGLVPRNPQTGRLI